MGILLVSTSSSLRITRAHAGRETPTKNPFSKFDVLDQQIYLDVDLGLSVLW